MVMANRDLVALIASLAKVLSISIRTPDQEKLRVAEKTRYKLRLGSVQTNFGLKM